MTGRARRALALLGVTATLLVVLDAPAGAHSTGGPPASNFHTVVGGLTPSRPGATVRVGPDGEQIELRVDGRARVMVLGYQGEPYLRVSRAGVFENRSSPAVELNRTRTPSGPAPRGPIRAPRWVRVSTGSTARWHDHRAHWMGGDTPAAVRRDPGRSHVVERWRIPLRVDGAGDAITGTTTRAAAIVGALRWDPPPEARLWFALAAGLMILVLAASRVAERAVLLIALAVLAIAASMHLWGSWPYSAASAIGRVGENLPSLAAVASTALAFVWLARRTPYAAAPLLIIAGLFTAVAGGFADLPVLSHAWVPTRLDPTLARALVAIALGLGLAVAIAGIVRLRAPRAS